MRTMWTRRGLGMILMLAAALAGGWDAAAAAGLRVGQPAPEITGERWINSEPLSLASLRGRVVVVEFWTYG